MEAACLNSTRGVWRLKPRRNEARAWMGESNGPWVKQGHNEIPGLVCTLMGIVQKEDQEAVMMWERGVGD